MVTVTRGRCASNVGELALATSGTEDRKEEATEDLGTGSGKETKPRLQTVKQAQPIPEALRSHSWLGTVV